MKKFSIAAAAMAAVLCFCACGKSFDETVITSATDNVAESPESENVEITDEETATSSEVDEDDGAAKNDGMKIVCTIFPEYDWVKEVLGEKAEDADTYKANADDYMGKLASLDSAYESAVSGASVKTVLFGDRFPFRYMTDDYGLDYYAAFVGCSAETEASFETIAFLSGKVDELGLKSVLTIEGQNHKIAETIISNTKDKNQQILTMDSMQSTTSEDVEGGVSYLGTMEQNLEVLKEALE